VQIYDNIYSIDKSMNVYGTHAYVINNANINKIYESTLTPFGPIDYQYEICIKNSTLNAVIIYPYVCLQDRKSFYSTIKNQGNAVVSCRRRRKNNTNVSITTLSSNNIRQEKEGQLRDSARMKKISSPPPQPVPVSTTPKTSSNTRNRKNRRTRVIAR